VLRVRAYPADLTWSVNENMDATGFSNVSNETLGVYIPAVGDTKLLRCGDGEGNGGDVMSTGDISDVGDDDRLVSGGGLEECFRAERRAPESRWLEYIGGVWMCSDDDMVAGGKRVVIKFPSWPKHPLAFRFLLCYGPCQV
jgi:hypothetical protein